MDGETQDTGTTTGRQPSQGHPLREEREHRGGAGLLHRLRHGPDRVAWVGLGLGLGLG